MTTDALYKSLNYVNHSREKRAEMAMLVAKNPHLIAPLFAIAFTVDDPISCKACWVLEFTAKEDLPYIFPYLTLFTANLSNVHLDSSVRPMAKICEYLTKSYFSKTTNSTQKALTKSHLEKMTTVCFDWLITDQKVAAKAYAMTSLLLLGKKFKWILPELKVILEKNYPEGSAAYKARARLTLAKIK
ncbi:adenylosuccinate lyase [Cellulophaga sp. E16_2]|uniref:Adenylosuccinate lyase n=1 Tax=Cellulophaga algicola (strain DSM 14237 / IC166 / ACAM 630) TaxID=688270 RepID=E6X6B0_CELAD|nr:MULTISPECIES: adenylosuccinate lyase [Cellulophaga]ADV47410.1 adenylosuccinate lyase [Cellulophaga algicola DSM 14237]MBO0589806.1 adenylosuccinate lyase [Cellulophaga sp. E16_2]